MRRLMAKISSIPHLFGKIIVIWCVGLGTAASVYALRILSRTGNDSSAVLAVILGFFGGELLVLCLRAILKKEKVSESDTEGEPYHE